MEGGNSGDQDDLYGRKSSPKRAPISASLRSREYQQPQQRTQGDHRKGESSLNERKHDNKSDNHLIHRERAILDGALRSGRRGQHEPLINSNQNPDAPIRRDHLAPTLIDTHGDMNNRTRHSKRRRSQHHNSHPYRNRPPGHRNRGTSSNIKHFSNGEERSNSGEMFVGRRDSDYHVPRCAIAANVNPSAPTGRSVMSAHSSCSSAVASANSDSPFMLVASRRRTMDSMNISPTKDDDAHFAVSTGSAGLCTQKSANGWVVFATGIHPEAQEEDLRDAFEQYGRVNTITLPDDRRSGFKKGYALVEYSAFTEAQDAINELHGKELLGHPIKVDWAFAKPR